MVIILVPQDVWLNICKCENTLGLAKFQTMSKYYEYKQTVRHALHQNTLDNVRPFIVGLSNSYEEPLSEQYMQVQ